MADRELDPSNRPPKRQRLSSPSPFTNQDTVVPDASANGKSTSAKGVVDTSIATNATALQEQIEKEERAGIAAFVSPDAPGFSGILKQRYIDFLVNELLPDGRVCHLEDDLALYEPGKEQVKKVEEPSEEKAAEAPEDGETKAPAEIASNDVVSLQFVFGEAKTQGILALYQKVLEHPERKARDFLPVFSAPITEKEGRTAAHNIIRRVFANHLETETQPGDVLKVCAMPPGRRDNRARGGKGNYGSGGGSVSRYVRWDQMGGEHLHFTLYKENKDTMEVINFLATGLKTDSKKLCFAGTKDRRGVTVQRISARRVTPEQLARHARNLFNARIGGLEYKPDALKLGDHGGNEFVISLRDCHFPGEAGMTVAQRVDHARSILTKAVTDFQEQGFINYFGLQRFGTYTVSTDAIGISLLSGDFAGAVDQILSFTPEALAAAQDKDSTVHISEDDQRRALGIHIWKTEGDSERALAHIPRRFNAEFNIIKHLGWTNRKTKQQPRRQDYQGALSQLPRNHRMLYVHAYQSLVWNAAATERLKRYGATVVAGDLVLVDEHREKEAPETPEEDVDADGEVIIRPEGANSSAGRAGESFERARALTGEEAASGKYSIFDVVLPQPGFDVEYPANDVGIFYKEFMGDAQRGGGLDPYDMRRKWKDISLPGSYRKMLAKPGPGVAFEVKTYTGDDEALVETDLQKLLREGKAVSLEETKQRYFAGAGAGKPASFAKEKEVVKDTAMAEAAEEKVGVVLKFQLGSSQYATMALRELMKGGTESFKPDFSR